MFIKDISKLSKSNSIEIAKLNKNKNVAFAEYSTDNNSISGNFDFEKVVSDGDGSKYANTLNTTNVDCIHFDTTLNCTDTKEELLCRSVFFNKDFIIRDIPKELVPLIDFRAIWRSNDPLVSFTSLPYFKQVNYIDTYGKIVNENTGDTIYEGFLNLLDYYYFSYTSEPNDDIYVVPGLLTDSAIEGCNPNYLRDAFDCTINGQTGRLGGVASASRSIAKITNVTTSYISGYNIDDEYQVINWSNVVGIDFYTNTESISAPFTCTEVVSGKVITSDKTLDSSNFNNWCFILIDRTNETGYGGGTGIYGDRINLCGGNFATTLRLYRNHDNYPESVNIAKFTRNNQLEQYWTFPRWAPYFEEDILINKKHQIYNKYLYSSYLNQVTDHLADIKISMRTDKDVRFSICAYAHVLYPATISTSIAVPVDNFSGTVSSWSNSWFGVRNYDRNPTYKNIEGFYKLPDSIEVECKIIPYINSAKLCKNVTYK